MTLNLKEEEQPDVYLNVLPVVTAENAGLHVQIPETNETSWRYELSIGDKKITGSAEGIHLRLQEQNREKSTFSNVFHQTERHSFKL